MRETTDRRPISGFLQGYGFVLSGNGVAAMVSLLISVRPARAMSVEGFGGYALFLAILITAWQIPACVDAEYVRYARTAARSESRLSLRFELVFKLRTAALMLGAPPLLGLVGTGVTEPTAVAGIFVGCAAGAGAMVAARSGGASARATTSLRRRGRPGAEQRGRCGCAKYSSR